MKAFVLIFLVSLVSTTLSKPFDGKSINGRGNMDMSYDYVMAFKNSDNSWNFKAIARFVLSMNEDTLAGLLESMFGKVIAAINNRKEVIHEEPEFVKLDGQLKSNKYEVGLLMEAKWVCTSAESENKKSVNRIMFNKLFDYITKNNIKMTAPVATKIEGNKYTMCFYLPKKAQENCPKPINDDVFIYSKPTMKIFKLGEKITGYKDEHFDSIKEKLEMRIEEEGRYINGYNKDFYITASYTDPTDQSNAYSEVWFVANEQQ